MKLNLGFALVALVGPLLLSGMGASLKPMPAFAEEPASAEEQQTSAEEQTIGCKDLPAAVTDAFHKAYANATIRECAKEAEKGRTAYEISSMDGTTRRDVLYFEDGTLIVVEETIPASELPEPVRQAADEKFPGHTLERAERIARGGEVAYELILRHKGKQVEIGFEPSGKEYAP